MQISKSALMAPTTGISNKITDDELIALLHSQEHFESAFEFLVNRYSRQLYAVIRRIVLRHEDADDVLQNTFIKVWKNIKSFRGDAKLSTWLHSIAVNEALSYIRREKAERKLALTGDGYDIAQMLVSDPYFDGDEAEAQLVAAIAELPEKQRLTFEMRYFDEKPFAEISQITGTSEGALKANYHHAVKKLKNYLNISDDSD